MKAGAHPALAQGKVRYVGDHVAVVIADTYAQARDAAEKIVVDYGVLPAVTRHRQGGQAGTAADPRRRAQQHGLQLASRRQGGDRGGFRRRPRMSPRSTSSTIASIPNAMEPRAAVGEYDSGDRRDDALYDEPEPARGASRALGLHRAGAREQAARRSLPTSAAASARRYSSTPRRPSASGRRARSTARSNGRPTAPRRSSRDAHGRDHVTHAELALDAERQDHGPARAYDRQPRRLSLDLLVRGADLSLCAAAVGAVQHPEHLCRGRRGLYQHRAGRRLSRRRAPGGDLRVERLVEMAARETGRDPAEFRRAELRHSVPASDAGDHGLRHRRITAARSTRRWRSPTTRASPRARRPRRPRASCAASASPPISRPAASRRRRRSARSAPASACWESAEVRVNPIGTVEVLTGSHSHGQGHETTFAQLVSARLGIPIENVSIVHGDTDKVQMGMGTYGSRSGAVGMSAIVQGARQDRGQGEEDRRPRAGSLRTGHRVQGRQVHRQGHRQVDRLRLASRSTPISRTSSTVRKWSPGLKESAFWDPTNFTFPAGVHICEVEIDPRDRRRDDRPLDGGRRLRQADQSDDRRGPGAWRHRPGHRPGAARGRRLQRGRPAADGELHGLRHAARRQSALVQRRHGRDALHRPIRSASRAAAKPAPSPRRRRSSTRSPTRSATRTSPCRRRRRSSGAPRRRP